MLTFLYKKITRTQLFRGEHSAFRELCVAGVCEGLSPIVCNPVETERKKQSLILT